MKVFIDKERKNPHRNISLESQFQEWETLIAKYNHERTEITQNTATATADARTDTTNPNITNQKVNELEIKDLLHTELQKNLKALESHEKLSIDNLDGRIESLLSIVNLDWIEKIPVLKEKGKELLQYQPIIQ